MTAHCEMGTQLCTMLKLPHACKYVIPCFIFSMSCVVIAATCLRRGSGSITDSKLHYTTKVHFEEISATFKHQCTLRLSSTWSTQQQQHHQQPDDAGSNDLGCTSPQDIHAQAHHEPEYTIMQTRGCFQQIECTSVTFTLKLVTHQNIWQSFPHC